jgi:protein-tyrosine kinase
MSRIHEALRRAQLERKGSDDPMDTAPSQSEMAAGPSAPPAPAPSGIVPPLEESVVAASFEPLTLAILRERCPVSNWKPDPKSTLFADSDDYAQGTEEFRTLRSRLYQIREKQPLQTLLVASALPAEGKTFVSLNLAQAIAQQRGRSVLVVDGDLRLSRIHQLLGASPSPGLTEYLQGEVDVLAILQRGPQENLFLIPGGKPNSNPIELIHTGRLRKLFDRLTPIFDWIVLDSPPSVPVSDASLLAELCDGVLLVVQSGSTPFDMAQKARQEFRDKHLVGVVLNRVPQAVAYPTGYYYYGYGRTTESKNGKS